MIIAPCGASESGCCIVGVRVGNSYIPFFVLAAELGHEGEIISSIKGRLDLDDKLCGYVCSCVPYAIVTVV